MAQRSLIEERRNRILDYITTNQKADVHELSLLLNETEITIRRDLIELEKSKKLIRVHGGAVINEQKKSVWHTSAVSDRLARNRDKKERIAQFAATLIQNDESIFIDGGSTNQILAPMIKDLNNMLFVTNSPDIADILLENENNRILQIGGELTRDTRLTTGPDAVEHIRKYFVDKFITSVSGLDPKTGCYSAIPNEASTKRTFATHARETILLLDSSKFNRKAFCLAFDLSQITTVVTDSEAPEVDIQRLRARGIDVFVV